ncbi:MAG: dNTP triphosphohydrolase, partial [Dysgonamonadaceae bacterium]|nr:dNTP triphosphohydrolase [Dysgonamonadaceae bacterium]
MYWKQLLSTKRFGMEAYHDEKKHDRTEFQRDYDRLIFSSPFRRLQSKTQVFPLPGSVFVHNRLTHSLEVSCVGRSLGDKVGKALDKRYQDATIGFPETGALVSAACLAHDLGNPPFGHSGEKAISAYFAEKEGRRLLEDIEREGGRCSDFVHFEGNANSLRMLTHRFKGRRQGGFVMTYATLAAIVKYPYASTLSGEKGKFGFFASEENDYRKIATDLGIICRNQNPLSFVRYPLVYLVEAADDICYLIMDLEDAHKLKLLTAEETITLLQDHLPEEKRNHACRIMQMVDDVNEKIAYLRSTVIGLLIDECSRVFLEQEAAILQGSFHGALIDHIDTLPREAYRRCAALSVKKIYRAKDVLDVELAGYKIIGFLLDTFIDAVLHPGKAYSTLLLRSFPEQFSTNEKTTYARIQAVIDYISGMTDVYALDLYRKLTGMNLPVV